MWRNLCTEDQSDIASRRVGNKTESYPMPVWCLNQTLRTAHYSSIYGLYIIHASNAFYKIELCLGISLLGWGWPHLFSSEFQSGFAYQSH